MANMPDAKVVAVINELSHEAATDILDDCFGVGCRDEQDVDVLRREVHDAYLAGKVDGAEIVMTYSDN